MAPRNINNTGTREEIYVYFPSVEIFRSRKGLFGARSRRVRVILIGNLFFPIRSIFFSRIFLICQIFQIFLISGTRYLVYIFPKYVKHNYPDFLAI